MGSLESTQVGRKSTEQVNTAPDEKANTSNEIQMPVSLVGELELLSSVCTRAPNLDLAQEIDAG